MAPILLVALLLAAVSAGGVGRLGAAVTQRARLDAIADVVALAAVTTDRETASRVARSNGAELVDLDHVESALVVVVEASGVRSTAAAHAAR